MAEKITKIAVLAPFAAGMGRQPGRFAHVCQDLAPALEVFGRDCVLEVPPTLVPEGRVKCSPCPPGRTHCGNLVSPAPPALPRSCRWGRDASVRTGIEHTETCRLAPR